MECLGPQCASMLLEWLKDRSPGWPTRPRPPVPSGPGRTRPGPSPRGSARRVCSGVSAAYQEDAAAVRTPAEFAGAVEHLEYAIFRRYQNQLTKAERARLDNTIDNALFKAERYASRPRPGRTGQARRRP